MTEGQWRINDADRDQALERLRTGYVDGRITRDELESRMTTLLRPLTYDEVDALLVDLPAPPAPGPDDSLANRPAIPLGLSRPPARRPPTRKQQRQRSLVASVVCLGVLLAGGTWMATAPVTDSYADSSGTGGANTDAFGAVPLAEQALLSAGQQSGYAVLRHNGAAAVLSITVPSGSGAASDAATGTLATVKVDDGGHLTRTSGRGTVEVVLPAGSQAIEVNTEGDWSYTTRPLLTP